MIDRVRALVRTPIHACVRIDRSPVDSALHMHACMGDWLPIVNRWKYLVIFWPLYVPSSEETCVHLDSIPYRSQNKKFFTYYSLYGLTHDLELAISSFVQLAFLSFSIVHV